MLSCSLYSRYQTVSGIRVFLFQTLRNNILPNADASSTPRPSQTCLFTPTRWVYQSHWWLEKYSWWPLPHALKYDCNLDALEWMCCKVQTKVIQMLYDCVLGQQLLKSEANNLQKHQSHRYQNFHCYLWEKHILYTNVPFLGRWVFLNLTLIKKSWKKFFFKTITVF